MFVEKKGQSSAEMMAVAIVILLLFLIIVTLVLQKNVFTNQIINVRQNSLLCDKISTIISEFESNPGYGQTKLIFSEELEIDERSITVNPSGCPNCHYCFYSGTVVGVAPESPLTITKNVEYLIEKTDEGVEFTHE